MKTLLALTLAFITAASHAQLTADNVAELRNRPKVSIVAENTPLSAILADANIGYVCDKEVGDLPFTFTFSGTPGDLLSMIEERGTVVFNYSDGLVFAHRDVLLTTPYVLQYLKPNAARSLRDSVLRLLACDPSLVNVTIPQGGGSPLLTVTATARGHRLVAPFIATQDQPAPVATFIFQFPDGKPLWGSLRREEGGVWSYASLMYIPVSDPAGKISNVEVGLQVRVWPEDDKLVYELRHSAITSYRENGDPVATPRIFKGRLTDSQTVIDVPEIEVAAPKKQKKGAQPVRRIPTGTYKITMLPAE